MLTFNLKIPMNFPKFLLIIIAVSLIHLSPICLAKTHEKFIPNDLSTCILKPQMRASSSFEAEFAIDTHCAHKFFVDLIILKNEQQLTKLPYIVGFDQGHLLGQQGELFYAKGILDEDNLSFLVGKLQSKLFNADNSQYYGITIEPQGLAILEKFDQIQSLRLAEVYGTVQTADRLFYVNKLNLPPVLEVKPPKKSLQGEILAIYEARAVGSVNQSIIINLGADEVQLGDKLALRSFGRKLEDPFTKDLYKTPTSIKGEAVVYKIFENVALALVLNSESSIKKGDEVISVLK